MKKVFKMFAAAIALAFAAVACDPAQNEEIVPDEATYAIFTEAYNALTDQYSTNTAATILNTVYGDEKYAAVVEKYTPVFTAIEAKIKDLKTTADAFYADNVLADHIEELKAAILDLKVELAKAVVDFGAEITAIDEAYAAEQALIAANDAAYEQFAAEYESLQQQYTTVYNRTVANEEYADARYSEVIENYTATLNGIYQQMANLQTWADESYEARTLATDLDEILSNFEGIQILLTQFLNAFNDEINLIFVIKFETTGVLYNKISATATVTNPEIYYLFQCEEKSYIDSFSSADELMSAEMEFWYNKYGTTYADYKYDSYADLLLNGLCYTGDSENSFTNLKESTDYVIYGFAIDSETLQPASELFTLEVSTPGVNWVKLGVGTLTEPFTTMFGEEALVISVDVYQESNNPGLYMYKGVGLQLANWFYEQDMTAYEGRYWDDEGIIFDATDPDKVVIENQYYGFYAGSSYGWPVLTTVANGQTAGYGKLANGHLTLTAREYLVGMGTSYYYGPAGFDLALPSAATYVAPSKVNYVEKGERNARTLVSAPAKETIDFSRSRR